MPRPDSFALPQPLFHEPIFGETKITPDVEIAKKIVSKVPRPGRLSLVKMA